MGAHISSVTFNACSVEELKKQYSRYQEELRDQEGSNGYAGHLGIVNGLVISSQVFSDGNKASDYLENVVKKYQPAIAVRVGDFSKIFPHTATEKKEYVKLQELESKVENWNSDLIKKVKSGKSLQKGCVKCGSKIAVKYIKESFCPVCHSDDFIETATEKKAFKILVEKVKQQKIKIKEYQKKYDKNKAYWLITGVCPS